MYRSTAIAMAVACVWTICAAPVRADVEDALIRLENWERGRPHADLESCVKELRAGGRVGDKALWQRLKRVVLDEDIPWEARKAAFLLACEKADDEAAREILGLIKIWALQQTGATSAPHCPVSGQESFIRTYLIGTFLNKGVNHLEQTLIDQEPLLDVLSLIGSPRHARAMDPRFWTLAYNALAGNPAPIEQRRERALSIIQEMRNQTDLPGPLLGLLDESSFPSFRTLVRASDDPDTFHFGAAAALAHLGDREILPDLEARRPRFREKSVNIEGYLVWFMWCINIQHPPAKLLRYISGPPEVGVARRMWAVRRAVELGIPKEELRQAILKHAEQVKPQGKFKIRHGLTSLKRQGLRLGILTEQDLPDIKVPALHITQ